MSDRSLKRQGAESPDELNPATASTAAGTGSYFAAQPHHVSIPGHIEGRRPDGERGGALESIMLHVFIAVAYEDDGDRPSHDGAARGADAAPTMTALRGLLYAESLDPDRVVGNWTLPQSAIPDWHFPVTLTDPATGAKRRVEIPNWMWKLPGEQLMVKHSIPAPFTIQAFDGHVPCVQVRHACMHARGGWALCMHACKP